jgi:hypothetical protein
LCPVIRDYDFFCKGEGRKRKGEMGKWVRGEMEEPETENGGWGEGEMESKEPANSKACGL